MSADAAASAEATSIWDTAAHAVAKTTISAAATASATSSSSSRPLNMSQMTASGCSESKLYTDNFPPLPTPNQKRVGGGGQNQKY